MENQANQPIVFRFEELRVYDKAMDYFLWANSVTENFGDYHREIIGMPLLESARHISVRIAEGSSRNKAQFVNSLRNAKISIRQCVTLSTLAHRLELLSEEDYLASKERLFEIMKMVSALISSIQRKGSSQSSSQSDSSSRSDQPNLKY